MTNNATVASQRQAWVDIAKGIAIIAVVMGHISFNWPGGQMFPLRDLLIWLWHVPVFFMIGGFFIKEERLLKPVEFIKGKIRGLYIPMICIYVPVLILHNVFINIGWYDLNLEYYGKYVTYWGITDFFKHIISALLCAGREPLLGAMWFGFVLFMALCIISLTSWLLKKLGSKLPDNKQEIIRGLLFLSLAIISCTLTKLIGLTIPRFNNTLVAIWLIYVGMLLFQKAKVTFSNSLIAISCGLIAWHSATILGGVDLVANDFSDVIALTITSTSCLYIVCYLSRLIERVKWLSNIMSNIGRDSLYIMGLHFLGFKAGTLLVNAMGMNASLAQLVPRTGNNLLLMVYYVFWGVVAPLLFIYSFRVIKKVICRN